LAKLNQQIRSNCRILSKITRYSYIHIYTTKTVYLKSASLILLLVNVAN